LAHYQALLAGPNLQSTEVRHAGSGHRHCHLSSQLRHVRAAWAADQTKGPVEPGQVAAQVCAGRSPFQTRLEMSVSISKAPNPGRFLQPQPTVKKNTVDGGAEIHCTSLLISKKKYWVSLALTIKEAICFLRNLEEGPPHQYLPNFPFKFFYCTVTFFCWQEEIICNNISKHLNARPCSLF
jgi:hypothetical protein